MDLVRRVVIEQADGKDLDSGLVAVQHRLGGLTRLAFDLLARCGVDRIDGAGRDRTPQRCQDLAAHEWLRFGEMVGEGQRILDPVLGRGPQVYEVAVAGEQEGVAGRRLLLEPDPASRLLRQGNRSKGQPAAKLRARRLLPRRFRWKSELEPLRQILHDEAVALERPGPSDVQARLEIRRQDPAEPQPHADLAGPDREESAPEPE